MPYRDETAFRVWSHRSYGEDNRIDERLTKMRDETREPEALIVSTALDQYLSKRGY